MAEPMAAVTKPKKEPMTAAAVAFLRAYYNVFFSSLSRNAKRRILMLRVPQTMTRAQAGCRADTQGSRLSYSQTHKSC